MVLEKMRGGWDMVMDPITRLLVGVNPNHFSFLSLVFAVAAGITYALSGYWVPHGSGVEYPWLLLFAFTLLILNSMADSLDGRVARLAGRTSDLGDFLDHTYDRLSDIAILVGISLSGFCHPIFGLMTVISVLLSSYMGTQAQAVGIGRDYSGIMGRVDRMVLLLVATALQFLLQAFWGRRGFDLGDTLGHDVSLLGILMAVMLVGGIFTTLQRGLQAQHLLTIRDEENARKDALLRRRGRSRRPPGKG
jgi:archaetidylinositol phosphate synthase